MLARFDPQTLSYTRIALPPAKNPKAQVNAVAIGPQDHVWFVDDGPNGRILEYNPDSREFNSFAIPEFRWPVSNGGWARTAALRFLDGMVWGSGETSDRILRLDPSTRKVTDYSVPRGSAPFGLAIGPDKTVWYAGLIGNSVVKLDPKTGRLEPHNLRTDRSELKLLAADSHLNLWATATESGKLIRVDSKTGDIVELDIPTENSGPFAIDVDTKRDLVWFSEIYTDRLARFDPSKNTFVEFSLPIADADVRRIAVDPTNPDRVWWVGARSDKFGYVEVLR
jgi:virginiamycin B lyase